jgi:sialate O-acetylesterase
MNVPRILRRNVIAIFLCTLGTASTVWAEVKLPAVFADNMVLQREIRIPVWGTAEPGEQVTVTVDDQRGTATADAEGRWRTEIGPVLSGGPYEMTVAGKNRITFRNVVVGEVWICSGQSNMEMAVGNSTKAWGGVRNAQEEIASGNFPMIRHFGVKKAVAGKPQNNLQGQWVVATPETVGEFTAVGYFFGREIHKALGVPVGLIHTSWGGTPAESWTSAPALAADPALASIVADWEKKRAEYPAALEKYRQQLSEWNQAAQEAEAEGRPAPEQPKPPDNPYGNPWRAAGLYNAMIAPLMPYGIRGAIWYQGESNAGRAEQYRKLFPAMIQDWRRAWGQGNFPFLFVQLAGFENPWGQKNRWPYLREAQLLTLSLPKTGMAVAIDIGDQYDIHPRNKQDVGRRLALAAQAVAYGRDIAYSGPIFESMQIQDSKVRLRFRHAKGGLVALGGKLRGFEIAGEDRQFVPAQAKTDGETVIVTSDKVNNPVAVRYAWADFPECNLYNKAGLPASPFRTDDWAEEK